MPQQQLELYFGLTVRVVREVSPSNYKGLLTVFKKWLHDNPDIKRQEPELYIHRLQFEIAATKFKIPGIENRLSALTVSVAINPKQRKKGTMRFINHRIGHRLSPTVQQSLGDFDNHYTLSGAHLTQANHFEEYLATVVVKSVSRNDRKVKFTLSAQATPSYKADTLKNVDLPVVTKLDFRLNKDVQLTMHFEGG